VIQLDNPFNQQLTTDDGQRGKSMKEEERRRDQRSAQGGSGTSGSTEEQTGDPGRTPGTAEGDEQTIDEDLRQKAGGGQS
jgi:hypothetical protein